MFQLSDYVWYKLVAWHFRQEKSLIKSRTCQSVHYTKLWKNEKKKSCECERTQDWFHSDYRKDRLLLQLQTEPNTIFTLSEAACTQISWELKGSSTNRFVWHTRKKVDFITSLFTRGFSLQRRKKTRIDWRNFHHWFCLYDYCCIIKG